MVDHITIAGEKVTQTHNHKLINIVEDDPVIRENLIRFLDMMPDIQVGITANSIEQYVEKRNELKYHQPSALLLDIGLPGKSGLEGIPQILDLDPNLDIIMLTTFDEERIVLKAICLGAVAYLSKKSSLEEIVNAIRLIDKGGSYMSPMIARDIFTHFLKANTNPMDKILTARQVEIINAMVDGKSHIEIGKLLFISPETVRSHVKNIYKALHVKNKAEAITKYLKSGMFS